MAKELDHKEFDKRVKEAMQPVTPVVSSPNPLLEKLRQAAQKIKAS